jgi:hypothetical protein
MRHGSALSAGGAAVPNAVSAATTHISCRTAAKLADSPGCTLPFNSCSPANGCSNAAPFAFDRIKIYNSFVADMAVSRDTLSMIRAITGMSNSLLIKTTAEGVETPEPILSVKADGCSHFQRYFLAILLKHNIGRSAWNNYAGLAVMSSNAWHAQHTTLGLKP